MKVPVRILSLTNAENWIELFVDDNLLALIDYGLNLVKHHQPTGAKLDAILLRVPGEPVFRYADERFFRRNTGPRIIPIPWPKRIGKTCYDLRLVFNTRLPEYVGLEVVRCSHNADRIVFYTELDLQEIEQLRDLVNTILQGVHGNG